MGGCIQALEGTLPYIHLPLDLRNIRQRYMLTIRDAHYRFVEGMRKDL